MHPECKGLPERIAVLCRQDPSTRERTLQAIQYNGQTISIGSPECPPLEWGDQCLVVDGAPYRYEGDIGSRWADPVARILEIGLFYRLNVGWRVLYSAETKDGEQMIPFGRFPVYDRAEAERIARRLVTRIRANFGDATRVAIVWQNGEEYGEPVATLDGADYTQAEAITASLENDLFPLDQAEVEDDDPSPDDGDTLPGGTPRRHR